MLWSYLALTILLLLIEAGLSLAEAAFFSTSSLAIARLKNELENESGRRAASLGRKLGQLEQLLARPSRLLGTLLISDTVVSVSLSSVFTLFVVLWAERYRLPESLVLPAAALALLVVLLIMGEVVPKLLGMRHSLRYALALTPTATTLRRVVGPIAALLDSAAAVLLKRARPRVFPTEAELETMIRTGYGYGTIKGDEGTILRNLVQLDRRRVSEVMTPRIDMIAVEQTQPVSQAIALIRRSGRSRIPVYESTIDRVKGIFYLKDYFALNDDSLPVGTVAREPYFVPEVKPLSALLDEFRKLGVHIAVVVDEFGQTAGIVTLEDALESIFGEIRDEHDLAEELPYFRIDDNAWLVDGNIDLHTLNLLCQDAFRGEPFERLAAFILHLQGHVPAPGDRIRFKNLTLEIKQVTNNAVERVLIRKSGEDSRSVGTESRGA